MPKSIFDGAHTKLIEVMVAARKRSGLTQTELAVKIGKGQGFISLIERSQRRIDVLEFIALAKAMGEDPKVLFLEVMENIPSSFDI